MTKIGEICYVKFLDLDRFPKVQTGAWHLRSCKIGCTAGTDSTKTFTLLWKSFFYKDGIFL